MTETDPVRGMSREDWEIMHQGLLDLSDATRRLSGAYREAGRAAWRLRSLIVHGPFDGYVYTPDLFGALSDVYDDLYDDLALTPDA